jgi:hypothetical protein
MVNRTKIRTAFVVAGILSLGACITTPNVSTKVVEGVRLENYKTFFIEAGEISDSNSAKNSAPSSVALALEFDVRKELERRGLKFSINKPDLTFRYAAVRRLEHAGEREWPYHEGAIDLVARDKEGRMVWSSHLQAVIDPSDHNHRHLKDAINRAFKNYPSISLPVE